MTITKKDLQEAVKPLATKDGLKAQTKELKAYAREQTAELAGMVKRSFDAVDYSFDNLERHLTGIETKLDRALYTQGAHLEPPRGEKGAVNEKFYLTLPEAVELSGLSRPFLLRQIKGGGLETIKDGAWKIRRSELEQLINNLEDHTGIKKAAD